MQVIPCSSLLKICFLSLPSLLSWSPSFIYFFCVYTFAVYNVYNTWVESVNVHNTSQFLFFYPLFLSSLPLPSMSWSTCIEYFYDLIFCLWCFWRNKMCFLYTTHCWILFLELFASLWLSGELRTLTLKVTTDRYWLSFPST